MAEDDDEIWALEERFWTGHRPFHEVAVSPDAVMCFGKPTGVVKAADAMAALDGAPDWAGVAMHDRVLCRPGEKIVVTGYLAEGDAGNGVLHRVFCASTWLRTSDGWKLVQHGQTPA